MMTKKGSSRDRIRVGVCAVLLLFTAGYIHLHAQSSEPKFPGVAYPRGQDVSPTFDGWESNPDGTYTMYFGYYNRNTQEEVDVSLGPDNNFDLGNGDQGQPTHFYTGRKWWVFKVVVPKDWPQNKRLVWTLTNRGRTNLAKGWLEPEWEVERSGIDLTGYRNRVPPGNDEKVPTISTTGGSAQTITLPETAKLTATAEATAAPNPDVEQGVNPKGVQIRWILYRGPGKVQFDPDVSSPVRGKPVTSETKVTFSAPGNYRIRAIGTDGALFSTYDVDVKVNPSTSAEKAR
jgi:hypothetical protein